MEGSYEILGVVGRTGLGTLYQARFTGEGGFAKLVNLKMLDEGVAESDEVACRLRDEARVLGFLKHQAIVQVDRLIRLAGRWTLVQEHVDGVDLDAIVALGPVPAGPALEIVAGVAGALHAAFTSPGPDGSPLRLQHRDIKPATVLVDGFGGVRVIDFGIARACFSGREARTRSFVVGSFEYMAPERLALEEGGPWSDVYSLGQVLFVLLTGQPFGRSHPSERHHKAILERAIERLLAIPGGVDAELLALLGRMLALPPHERPDARAVERTLHEIARRLGQEPLRAWAERVVEPVLRQPAGSAKGGMVGKVLAVGEGPSRADAPPPADPGSVGPRPAPGRVPGPIRPAERRDPLPVITFSDAQDGDATEIMVRPRGGARPRDADVEATDIFLSTGGPEGGGRSSADEVRSAPRSPAESGAGWRTAVEHGALTEPLSAELSLEEASDWEDGGPQREGRPTAIEEAPPEGERPTRVEAWSVPAGSRGEEPSVEVTAATPPGRVEPPDVEGPTFQQHAALASEPTALLGDRVTGEVEPLPVGAARFHPGRVVRAPGGEVPAGPEPTLPACEPTGPSLHPGAEEPPAADVAPAAPPFAEAPAAPEEEPAPPPFAEAPAAPPFAEAPATPEEEPAPPEEEPAPPPPPPAPLRPPSVDPTATWVDPAPVDPAVVQHGGPRRWTPAPRQSQILDRPQPDEWVPPSMDTLRSSPPAARPPAPVAEHDETFVPPAPPPVLPLDDTLVSRPEPEPTVERVTPLPTAPVGAITEVVEAPLPVPVEATVEDDAEPAPPAPRPAPASRRRAPWLAIALGLLLLGGLGCGGLTLAAGVAWFLIG